MSPTKNSPTSRGLPHPTARTARASQPRIRRREFRIRTPEDEALGRRPGRSRACRCERVDCGRRAGVPPCITVTGDLQRSDASTCSYRPLSRNARTPALDRTIHSATIVRALAADVESLPRYPLDERCPADFGTYYFLTFTFLGSSPLSAKIEAEGCEVVQVPGKPVQWAARSPQLWADLTRALGFDPRNLPPPQSDAGTVAGGIQQLCSTERIHASGFAPFPRWNHRRLRWQLVRSERAGV